MQFMNNLKLKSVGRNLFDSNKIQHINLSENSINYEITDDCGFLGVLTCDFLNKLRDSGFKILHTSNLREVLKNQFKSVDELLNTELLYEKKIRRN